MKKNVAKGYFEDIIGPMNRATTILFSLLAALILMCGIFVSCGGEEDVIPAEVSGDLTNTDDAGDSRLRGNDIDDYTGKVVIKFKDGTNVRLNSRDSSLPSVAQNDNNAQAGPFVSRRTDSPREAYEVRRVNEVVRSSGLQSAPDSRPPLEKGGMGGFEAQVTNITRVPRATEEEVDRWREDWARRGVKMHDWNLYYYLDVPDEEDARELVKELNEKGDSPPQQRGLSPFSDIIEYAGILPRFYLTEVTTPDISNEQGYLKSASQGGLGIEDGWALLDSMFPGKEIRGQKSRIVDQEYDWNFDHEILPIDETEEYLKSPEMWEWNLWTTVDGKDKPININHGTAVVGIIAAQGDKIGKAIKGIVPDAKMRVASIEPGVGVLGGLCVNPNGESEIPGTVYTIEVQQKGITTGPSGCDVGDGTTSPIVTGCVPKEADKFLIDDIQDSVNCGKIVIEGAGNGGVNMDDPNQAAPKEGMEYFSYFSDPANDSGAIMVGASLGADRRKASWSNCGSRVDVYAWGAGVVTAGYGDKFNPDGADPNVTGPMGADNPKLYTGQFGGTSAATAQIAGMAALVQSYVRHLVEAAGYEPKVVYLDSKQMRTILKNSGQPAVYGQTPNDPNPNCNIGVQPDMAKAIDETNAFLNAGNLLNIVPLKKDAIEDPAGSKSGISYDMDGDGRAELISFSRDGKWYIDLSSVPPQGGSFDGYGAWDLILTIPSPLGGEGQGEGENAMLFPVVNRYTYYGTRADLSIYDSVNGKWYIKYTAPKADGPVEWGGIPLNWKDDPLYDGDIPVAEWDQGSFQWDRVIDYSNDPLWRPYSRPVPGDYDGDHHLDIALQTPDGHWLIDYSAIEFSDIKGVRLTVNVLQGENPDVQLSLVGINGEEIPNPKYFDTLGSFDKDVKYLTDEQLAQAPGWAWLPAVDEMGTSNLIIRVPDGLTNEGKLLEGGIDYPFEDTGLPAIYGKNDTIFTTAAYEGGNVSGFGVKRPDGSWQLAYVSAWDILESPEPAVGYGDINCRPVPADYDGDGKDDRAVQCGTSWKIAYSSQPGNLYGVELDQAIDPLPAFAYSGGIKYQETVELYNYYKGELGGTKTSTIFDALPPIGPYFAQCVKYWAPNAPYCWNK